MTGNPSHVKQLLTAARMYRRPDMLQDIVREVRDTEAASGRLSAELRVLCAEVAVELKQWGAAAELLKGVGAAQETRLLAVRRIFCEVLVSLHHVDENTALTEEDKAQEYVGGAASVLQALAEGVEVWPDSLDAVLTGIRTLWTIVSPLLASGHDVDVCDAVVFLATLHQQLRIGGGYTLVQWLVRAALCLRAAERYAEAAARFSAALEAAALLGNQHLFVQVLRLAAVVILIREKAGISSKARTDLLPSYRGRPVHFAVLLTQLVLGGQLDMETCREDLQAAYESLSDGVDAPPPAPDASAAAVRGKKKQAVTKPPPAVRLVDAFAITETEVVDEVKVDVLFCISLHGSLTPEQVGELERKRSSSNRRVRSFAIFALVVRDARRHGLSRLRSWADAASITSVHKAELRDLATQLAGVLKNTNAIHDESERQHTLRVGAVLLWNLVLPFLQSAGIPEVQAALSVVADVSQASLPALRELFVQVATRQCQAAYEEDNRSVLHQLIAIAQRECERGEADGAATAACSFRLQWMDHQMTVRDELESSLTTAQDRCLFALEQARWISNPLKRIPVIKTAFRHLPPIVQDVDGPTTATETAEAAKAAGGGAATALVTTRRSTVRLYRELLDLCLQDLSPSLHAVAMAVAEALRSLPSSAAAAAAVGAADSQVEEVRAAASLQAATILARQVEETETHPPASEGRHVRAAGVTVSTGDDREGRLAALIIEAAQRGVELENRHSGHGSWIAANACATFLNWKKSAYTRGEYRTHLSEVVELQKLYSTLFERQQAQDVELLADLTSAAVLGLAADFLATAKPSPTPAAASPTAEQPGRDGSATLVRRLRLCPQSEPQNPQLRRAHALCSEALHLIPSVKQKWFVAMLAPALTRLVSDKSVPAVHPQEQLLMVLGTLAGPAAATDQTALLFSDARPLLRKDPCVRLCAWVAAVAVQLRQEEVALECCEMADRLYASSRLGWGTLYDVQAHSLSTNGANAATSGATTGGKAADSGGGGGGGNGIGAGHKKGSDATSLVAREAAQPYPKPDAEDWGAYAELLSIKAQVGVEHLQGLAGEARSRAVQLLLTTCVNSAIASIHGPAASKADNITCAYSLYYTLLRTSRISLSTATFVLPSLRMLLSKALLAQLPKRSWSDVFTNVVYQLSSVLMYVSNSSGDPEDARQLTPLLRALRDLLPPRYQKSLRVREVTEACHRDPSVEYFLQASRNVEADLQARGWMIVGSRAGDAGGQAEAFALALAAAQGNAMATAQCLFEHAYTAMERHGDSTPVTHVTALLQEALRTLEGLPESAPLLHGGSDEERRWTNTLAEASLTATFLSGEMRAALQDGDDELAASGDTRSGRRTGTTASKAPRRAQTTKVTGVTFQHLFLALRIVALLFRTLPVTMASGGGATLSAEQRSLIALRSRRDCASLILDYVRSLWHLCGKWVRESAAEGAPLDMHLPTAAHLYYGYSEPSAAARMVRRCAPDEEFQLNTEGLWESLLEVGDYLVSIGDEPHCFAVFTWVRFAAALAFGDAASDSRCGVVQRLCNWKMCAAASACGLANGAYMSALAELADPKPLMDEAVRRDLEEKRLTPSWEVGMVLGECEIRCQLGETEEAVVVARDVLCRGDECGSWAAADIKARALRIRAAHEATCSHYGAALRTLQAAFDAIAPTSAAPSTAPSAATLRHWVDICGDRVQALMASHATVEAVQCAALVRKQLLQWRDAVVGPALSVRSACVRAGVQAALGMWIRRLTPTFALQFPLDTPLAYRPAFSTLEQRRTAVQELLREIVLLAEKAQSPQGRFAALLAQWHARGRVTPQWVAQHGEKTDEVRGRLQVLLVELHALQAVLQQLRDARAACSPGEAVSQHAAADGFAGSSLALLAARINYWTAVDRIEVSTLASCLLAAFRQLTMANLRLPTSNAPTRCEKEVLRFIRGAVAAAPAASAAGEPPSPFTAVHGGKAEAAVTHFDKIGERWQSSVTPDAEELEQALRHYGIDGADAATMLNVASVPALLETAAAQCSEWPHTRLSLSILVSIAQVEVLRRLEGQLERADDLVGVELQSRLHGLLTAAWRRARLVPARADKPGSRARKSMASGKRRSLSESSPVPPTRPLSDGDQELLHRVSLGVEEAARHGHFDMAAQLSSELSHIAALLDRPQIAAAAAEQTQTNQLVGLLWRCCVNEMMDCPEGRAWRQMRAVLPAFTNARSYARLVDLAAATTPMERGMRGCGVLCVETEKSGTETPPATTTAATAKSLHTAELSPYAVDTAVLSVAVDDYRTGACIVTLRHPDGVVEGRRRPVPHQTWATLHNEVNAIEARKHAQLCGADVVRTGSAEERVTAEDLADMMKRLNELADELFGEFQPSLQQYCEKTPVYLCLAPELQALPWEQTSVLGCCSAVLRELGAATVVAKLCEPQRGGKRGSQQPPKSAGGNATTKSPAAGPMLCFIDVFGDHRDSVVATIGPDLAKSKVAPQHLVTCSTAGSVPDAGYLAWLLRSTVPGSLVVNMCGSLLDAVPWPHLASLNFAQLNGVVLADGAANPCSQQREERERLAATLNPAVERVGTAPYPRWMAQALFLLRGAKFVAANTFPCSPAAADVVARRCLASASSGKALVEQLRGKTKDAKTPFVTFYGVLGAGSTKGKA